MWRQTEITLKARARGCHLVTREVLEQLDLSGLAVGLANFFIQHTSASLTINENADPTVRSDMELALNHIVPANLPFDHTAEGPDDMPAHVKASLMGTGLIIPIRRERLALGTWQGLYLNEHRDHGGSRRIIVTCFGDAR